LSPKYSYSCARGPIHSIIPPSVKKPRCSFSFPLLHLTLFCPRFHLLPPPQMHPYPAPSDHNSTFWPPTATSTDRSHPQPAVTRDTEDRYGPPRLRASSAYATIPQFPPTHRDSYHAQTQSDCAGQYAYPPQQQYISGVNYAAPPFDFSEYPIIPGSCSTYPSGQYATQAASSTVTRYEYPPSDPPPFHHTTYDPTGYFTADGHYCPPLDGQHQQSLVSDPSGYLRCDDSFDHYDAVTQHSVLSIPPSSSSSELGNALVEIRPPEPQQGRASIALPTLPLSSHAAPKHDSSETAVGLISVKAEYGAAAGGQSFSPMTPLNSPSLTSDHAPPYIKEEEQEQHHVGNSSMPRPSSPLHGHGSLRHRQRTLDSFRVVQDPAAYPEFAPSTKRHPLPPSISIPGPLSAYSPGARRSTPLSSSFSSSDTGTPTSSVNLMDTGATSSHQAATLVPNPKAGQGVLKLPSTKRSARRKPAIACLFCRERKIACGAPPVGSADTTCNQCARRSRKCEYPTMSRRGLHKRRDNGGGHHRESEDADYVPTT